MKQTLCSVLVLLLALSACTGGSSDRETAARRAAQEDSTRFLREIGFNPDTMLIKGTFTAPEEEDFETTHNRWLTMEQITALGLDQLCDADTSMSPIAIMGVYPVEKQLTAVLFQQYLGDSAPLRLLTFNGDGIPVDCLNLGTCSGVNTRYYDQQRQAVGVETAQLTFAGRQLTVSRELQLLTPQHDVLWTAAGTDTYELDQRGYVMHRQGTASLDEMDDGNRIQRTLEALDWYSKQDEQAMDAMHSWLTANNDTDKGFDMMLFMRLCYSPWTTAHWLYTHQDSPLLPVLSKTVAQIPDSHAQVATALEAMRDSAQNQFLSKVLKVK